MLELRGVSKTFGPLKALDDVSLHVSGNVVAGLIGPNGSGKSTLLHTIVARVQADSGQMSVDGTDITTMSVPQRVRAGLSIKFQLPRIYRELTPEDNLLLAAQRAESLGSLMLSRSRRSLQLQIDETLERFRLADVGSRAAGALSHGQQQWLEIAMAMSVSPKVLLLDEPTGGMSPEERAWTGEIIHELSSRCSVLIVEHDLDWIRRLCDQITVLHQGRVVLTGTPAEIERDENVKEVYRARV